MLGLIFLFSIFYVIQLVVIFSLLYCGEINSKKVFVFWLFPVAPIIYYMIILIIEIIKIVIKNFKELD